MPRPSKLLKLFEPSKTPKGGVGYDNARENIDPRILTKALITKEISGQTLAVDSIKTENISGANLDLTGQLHVDGRVGFGTHSPTFALDVRSDGVTTIPALSLYDKAGGTTMLVATTGGYTAIGSTGVYPFHFITSGLNRMTISGANVGIGTENPKEKLEVVGTISGSNFYATEGISAANIYAFDTLIVSGSNLVVNADGNVGIGTTAPNSLLDLSVYTNDISRISMGSGNILGNPFGSANDPAMYFFRWTGSGTSATGYVMGVDTDKFTISTGGATTIGSHTWTPKFTIQNNGNVGIGTTTPFNDLHVKATTDAYQFKIQADSSSAENWAGLGFTVTGSDSLQPYAGIRAIRKTGFSDVDLSFRAGNDGEVMYLDGSTGNVGIGTISPSEILTVSGSQLFTAPGTGLAYGSIDAHEIADEIAVLDGTYSEISGANLVAGLTNNITVSGANLVLDYTGTYKVNWSLSASSAGTNKDYDFDVFKNGVEQQEGAARRKFGPAVDIGNLGSTGIIQGDAGDYFNLKVKGNGTTDIITLYNFSFDMIQIGG